VAERSEAWVCGLSSTRTMGSNPAEGMDVFPLCSLCVLQVASSATADDLRPTRYVYLSSCV
jgi:hypothetical protein